MLRPIYKLLSNGIPATSIVVKDKNAYIESVYLDNDLLHT
jgi:hypothetical protein